MEQEGTHYLPLFATFFGILPQTSYLINTFFGKVMNVYEHKDYKSNCDLI